MNLSRESPNSRIAAIRRFLQSAPARADKVRLVAAESTPIPLGEWLPSDVSGERVELVADEVEALLVDHASETPRYRSNYLLAFVDAQGAQITCKSLSVYGHQLRGTTPEDAVRELDGQGIASVAQAQRHVEALMRMHLHWEASIFETMTQTITRLTERVMKVEESNATKHDELLEAKETILGLVEAAAESELTPAQAKAFELMTQIAPSLMAWLDARTKERAKASAPSPNGKREVA